MMSAGHGQVGRSSSFCVPRNNGRLGVCPCILRFVLLVVTVAFNGCSRFPAIDPNGQNIFLPYPAATQLTLPQVHAGNGNPGIIPQDAYPTPLPPPACLDGTCEQPGGVHNLFQHHKKKKQAIANHFAKKDPGQCGQIQLSPLRIVAPVNGEVLLLAGICGKDGYLLKREPLEWMLAPGSVGQFIEVGDDAKGKLCSSFRTGPKVEKLGVDFARGRTSSKATLLTKGTPGCDDDLEVAEGQTWLSLSSPNEGVSRVTVLAPDSELWDKRRQTATIYWVDSRADFPQPIRIDTVQPASLSTHVTSAEGMVPATGWKVRYTILDPNIAQFILPNGTSDPNLTSYVAEVGPDGIATANLRARGPIGSTPVHIEVIKPMKADQNLPELILHQADTFVTVSAPGLELFVNGPRSAAVGEIVEYKASIANSGDLVAENVELRFTAPTGTTIIEVQPPNPTRVNDSALWQQGPLEPGRQVDFIIRLKLDAPNTLALQFDANAVGMSKQVLFPLSVAAPSVSVSMVRKPENTTGQAEVNEIVYYEVGVKNTGTSALVNLIMQLDTSVGWQEANSNKNSVQHTIALLQPGQIEVIPLALRVIQEGPHTAEVTIKGPIADQKYPPVGVTGIPPRARRPRVEATIRTLPENQTAVGRATSGLFTVRNTGETVLESLDVMIKFDPALEARAVDTQNSTLVRMAPGDNSTLRWTPRRLMPNEFVALEIAFIPRAVTNNAGLAMTVVSGEITANASTRLEIIDGSSGSVLPPGTGAIPGTAPGTAPGGGQARSGGWQLSVGPMLNPTVVGNEVSFRVAVRNAQNLQDTNLRIEIAIPEGLTLNRVERGGAPIQAIPAEGGVWRLPAENFLRPNETLQYFVVVTPRLVQEAVITVAASSDGQPTRVIERGSVTVNPRP